MLFYINVRKVNKVLLEIECEEEGKTENYIFSVAEPSTNRINIEFTDNSPLVADSFLTQIPKLVINIEKEGHYIGETLYTQIGRAHV